MRVLLWLTVLAAAVYGGYWFFGSRMVLNSTKAALTEMKAAGRADFAGVALRGFPSRFDLTIDAPRLSSRDGQVGWQAAFVQVFALSYRPNHLIAVWPDTQTLTLGSETLTLASSNLRASASFAAGLTLPLDHAELEGHDLSLSSDFGWSVLADTLILASRQKSEGGQSHELALVLTGLAPGAELRSLIDPMGLHPGKAEARLDLTAVFDRTINRTLTATTPRLIAARGISAQITWGQTSLEASGDLGADARGFVEGRLDLTARNWRDIYGFLQAFGVIDPDFAPLIENGLAEVAKVSGEAEVLKMPLIFGAGQTSLGPIPLGPAPRL